MYYKDNLLFNIRVLQLLPQKQLRILNLIQSNNDVKNVYNNENNLKKITERVYLL